jgi:pimeloyl-ACP methyl ester carboxylesterase
LAGLAFTAFIGSCNPEISEMLLQEGADPNYRDAELNAAMALEEGWTAWIVLLQGHRRSSNVEKWIATVKVFLKHGADPTVRWYGPDTRGHGEARKMKFWTPDVIIKDSLAPNPEDKKDLVEIIELLRGAKAKVGLVQ